MLSSASAAPTTPNLDLLSLLQQASSQAQAPNGAAGSGSFNDMLSGTLTKSGAEEGASRKPVLVKSAPSPEDDRRMEADAKPQAPAENLRREDVAEDDTHAVSAEVERNRDAAPTPVKPKTVQEIEQVTAQIEDALNSGDVKLVEAIPLMQQLLAGLQQLQAQAQAAVDGGAPLSPAALQQVQDVLSRAASGLDKLAQVLNLMQAPTSGVVADAGQGLSPDLATSQQQLPGAEAEFAELMGKVKELLGSQAQRLTQLAQGQHHRQSVVQPSVSESITQAALQPNVVAANSASTAQPAAQATQAVQTVMPEASVVQAPTAPVAAVAEVAATPVQQAQPQSQPQAANIVVAVDAKSQPQTGGGKQFGTTDSGAQTPLQVSLAKTEGASKTNFAQTLSRLSSTNVVEQIQAQVKAASKGGVSRIVVTLDPVELGEVEIKMEIGANGKTGVVISVDRPQTLELLQRDMRQLQQVLTDAGLKSDAGSLSFNLRGGEQQAQQQQQPYKQKHSPLSEEFDEAVSVIKPEAATLTMRSGINIKA